MGYIQKEWLIYFYEAPYHHKYDWLYFLKKGFKHCGALGYDPHSKVWTHLEYTHEGVVVEHLTQKEVDFIFNYMYDFKMLRCPVHKDWQLLRIKDMHCVSWIMSLIGYYRWWIFTPYQLYCALIKDGYSSFYKNYGQKEEKKQNTRRNNR